MLTEMSQFGFQCCFSLLDLGMNDRHKKREFCPPHLVNVATLPCETLNTANARQHKFNI